MTIAPIDMTNALKRFRRSLRGYKASDVEQFLGRLSLDLEAILTERASLLEKVEGLQQRLDTYYAMEELLKSAVISAENAAQQRRESAKKEAELVLADANRRRSEILDDAHKEAQKVRGEIEGLRTESERLKAQMRSLLQAELSLLESGYIVVEDKDKSQVDESRASTG
jgi:cell division initiation protein